VELLNPDEQVVGEPPVPALGAHDEKAGREAEHEPGQHRHGDRELDHPPILKITPATADRAPNAPLTPLD
jgi:hypothetical protein